MLSYIYQPSRMPIHGFAGKVGGGSKRVKKGRGGIREEIRQLKEMLGVDDADRTPQVRGC